MWLSAKWRSAPKLWIKLNHFCYFSFRLLTISGGKPSSENPHDIYLFIVFRLSHHLSVSQDLVVQAVFKLAPCYPSIFNSKELQVNHPRFKAHIHFMGVDNRSSLNCNGSSGAMLFMFVIPVDDDIQVTSLNGLNYLDDCESTKSAPLAR